jgi:hypothetical protein
MCLRLYLNGDSDVRKKHLSLFFVIMRGNYDAILTWPFPYKVSFRLIDQLSSNDNQRHIVDSFWPDIRSHCFRRPVYNMNDAYGNKQFVSVVQFKQNQSRFICDDTMFIEVKLDYLCGEAGKSSYMKKSPFDYCFVFI